MNSGEYMRNKHLYKKLKYELTLSFIYNLDKNVQLYKPQRQTLWRVCKYFNIEFTNHLYITISVFARCLRTKMLKEDISAFYNYKRIIDYANFHHLRLYDMDEHKIINYV